MLFRMMSATHLYVTLRFDDGNSRLLPKEAMLFGDFVEKNQGEVAIKDVVYEEFRDSMKVLHNAPPPPEPSTGETSRRPSKSPIDFKARQGLQGVLDGRQQPVHHLLQKALPCRLHPWIRCCPEAFHRYDERVRRACPSPLSTLLFSLLSLFPLSRSCSRERWKWQLRQLRRPAPTAPLPIMSDSSNLTAPHVHSDIALVIEDKRIYVNKGYLAFHSPVFHALFFGEFAEKGEEEIEIKDVDYKEMLDMLQLLCHAGAALDESNVPNILKLADRFQVQEHLIEHTNEECIREAQQEEYFHKMKSSTKDDIINRLLDLIENKRCFHMPSPSY
ncbi:hypothetical protein PRIPAC_76519 [Pristionchus pacificus]|uniref:BTB domain-containing protein n=1 Tax=Pristionchus pacificus TaxID=54126 RepID=A0A2A6CZQ0_PRIPA|nr:hypothetical protein PRIPAC_76519 [Pristionchus pacificus]|eukprot:PDM83704.1 BTB domain-containing protein [Pristionchus pacificus]